MVEGINPIPQGNSKVTVGYTTKSVLEDLIENLKFALNLAIADTRIWFLEDLAEEYLQKFNWLILPERVRKVLVELKNYKYGLEFRLMTTESNIETVMRVCQNELDKIKDVRRINELKQKPKQEPTGYKTFLFPIMGCGFDGRKKILEKYAVDVKAVKGEDNRDYISVVVPRGINEEVDTIIKSDG